MPGGREEPPPPPGLASGALTPWGVSMVVWVTLEASESLRKNRMELQCK
jgi:hypothetical protein